MLFTPFRWPLQDNKVTSGASGESTSKAGKGTINHAQIEKNDVKSDGNGNVALGVSSNHVLQFPRQPKRDDGKWVAVGSLLGALLGKIASRGIMKQVAAAESKWKEINDALYNKGKDQWDKAPSEWDKLLKAEADVDADAEWNLQGRDNELNYAYSLDNCNDAIHNKLCAYIQCGYKPDYYGIATRTIATAEAAAAKECREMKKTLNRYAVRTCCDIGIRIATAKVMSVVGTVSKLREAERQKQWEINEKLLHDGAELFEKHRQQRINDAVVFDKQHSDLKKWLYDKRNYNYFKLVELGGEFLAAAGKNYGWLADSLRKSSEKDTGGLASLGSMLAVVAAMFFCGTGSFCNEDGGCSGGEDEVTNDNAREQGGHNGI